MKKLPGESSCLMKNYFARFVAVIVFFCVWQAPAYAGSLNTPIIPLDQIHTGMRGVAFTVFEGIKPEPMDVEVLGVMKSVNGPKGDIILVRLHGPKVEHTGVVAGMSGSPVYFEGKLAGALSLQLGIFTKEPLAGVTPIEHMLSLPKGQQPGTILAEGPQGSPGVETASAMQQFEMPTDWASRA